MSRQAAKLVGGRNAAGHDLSREVVQLIDLVRVDIGDPDLFEQPFPWIAEQPAGGLVGLDDAVGGGIDEEYRVGQVLHEVLVLRLPVTGMGLQPSHSVVFRGHGGHGT